MGEEFQVGVCGGNWWNPSRNLFCSSTCSSGINDIGAFMGWPNHDLMVDMKSTTRSSDDSTGSVSDSKSPQDVQQTMVNGTMPLIDSSLEMMGINLCSSTNTDDWNQEFFHDNSRSEGNYSQIFQESAAAHDPSINYRQENSSITSFKQSFHQQPPFTTTTTSTNIPLVTTASYSFPSPLLQTLLFDSDSPPQTVDFSNDYMPKPPLQFTNGNITAFWNATAAPLTDVRARFLPSTMQSNFVNNPKPNLPNFAPKHNNNVKAGVEKKSNSEPAMKRPRIETPSSLPTFKVRKEKLGDRITALQQLVSPFGKTDTASVLHEAIEYIKFLHDQVNVLSTPYLKSGPPPFQRQHGTEKIKDQDGMMKHDLESRGLCLVPISSTFPVATETTSDFWTPTFGGSFR